MNSRSETHSSPPDAQAQLSSSSAIPREKPYPQTSARINNLPTEILAQILLLCVIKNDETIWDDSRFGMVRLRKLRNVCAQWNDTILGEPTFWTHIDILVEGTFAVDLKLLRSGALPLTIRYFNTEAGNDVGGRNPEFYTIMDLIRHQIHRWKSISFWAEDHELDQMTQYLQDFPLPEMEFLKIRRYSISPDILAWGSGDAPKLRTVVLHGQALPWNSSEFRSLVHIEIEGAIGYLDLLVDLIRASQRLETLRMTDIIFTDQDVDEQQRVGWPDESHPSSLPRLRDINISGFESPAAIACVLRCIRAPNVMRLRMFEAHTGVRQGGGEVARALTIYHRNESILTSMLHNISPFTQLELHCSQDVLSLELDDPARGLLCRLELSLLHADWADSIAMIAVVVRLSDVTVRLKFGRPPFTVIGHFLGHFSMTTELEFTSSDMPVQDILLNLGVLSEPINLEGDKKMWVFPQLAKLRLPGPGEKSEAEVMAITEAAVAVKHARRDFYNQNAREGDGSGVDGVSNELKVLIGNLEIG